MQASDLIVQDIYDGSAINDSDLSKAFAKPIKPHGQSLHQPSTSQKPLLDYSSSSSAMLAKQTDANKLKTLKKQASSIEKSLKSKSIHHNHNLSSTGPVANLSIRDTADR
jgi:hypothetical protein